MVSEPENEITGGVSEKEDQSLCWYPDPANMPLDMVGDEGNSGLFDGWETKILT